MKYPQFELIQLFSPFPKLYNNVNHREIQTLLEIDKFESAQIITIISPAVRTSEITWQIKFHASF